MEREANIYCSLFMSHTVYYAVISFVSHKSHSEYYHHFTYEYPEEDNKYLNTYVKWDTVQF